MFPKANRHISDFRVVGINYKKTDASIRGQFAITNEQYARLLSVAPAYGLHSLFIVSTCNRTEIYGFADHPAQMMELICAESEGSLADFSRLCYTKSGMEAIDHLFNVSAGLDSQILGDYEILGQIKAAVKFAKERDFIGPFLERLINCVLQSSKAIKTKTQLSSGTVSVSFTAVQYIKDHFAQVQDKKILLVGAGKIGRNTCKNMVHYLGTTNITLINRTEEKAAGLAEELNLNFALIEDLESELRAADIIIVATNAPHPTVLKQQVENCGNKLIIDLSIPCNVEADVKKLAGITFIGVDELSKTKDETLQMREREVPKAVAIIKEHISEFTEWFDMRRHVPVLKEAKNILQEIYANPLFQNNTAGHVTVYAADSEVKIQKVINTLAIKMRRKNTTGCHFIEAINEFIA